MIGFGVSTCSIIRRLGSAIATLTITSSLSAFQHLPFQ